MKCSTLALAPLLVGSALLALGCYGESIHPPEEPRPQPGPEGTDVKIDPTFYDRPNTSELDTEKVRPIAKTIEWPGISTEEGTSYVGDAVVVDKIYRQDSDNSYGVRVRLKNTSKEALKLEYLFRFYTRNGAQLAAYVGGIGGSERWQGVVLEPFGYGTVNDFSRVLGADGFRLSIRGGGLKTDGSPDDPSQKEERRQKRAAAEPPK